MKAVVEFQGFLDGNNDYIIKELVIMCVETGVSRQWLFRPPSSSAHYNIEHSQSSKWLSKYYHGLAWASGETDYYHLEHILLVNTYFYDTIYTKGLEKCSFLSKLMRRCLVNLDDIGCPSVKTLQYLKDTTCKHHKDDSFSCALVNATKLVHWLMKVHAVAATV